MRLIEADNFLERFEKMCETETDNVIAAILRGALINEPTAYSVDGVVEELEEVKTINVDVGYGTIYKTIRKDVAIEIIKQCGVSDDVCEWKQSERFRGMETFKTGCCGRTMILTSLEVANMKDCPQYAMKYCPYCGKKIKAVEQ